MIIKSDQLAKNEANNLAPYATLNQNSQGRHHPDVPDEYRLPFQRDRDRIIHSRSFRRLKDKTQVFIATSGDHFRNRLTHTMEVAQVSRDIARTLGLNEDLAETIALAHDLGHTPFGHAGETALNDLMQQFSQNFEHNEQSKRTVELLEQPYPNFPGLNLTQETLDGLMKHQSPYDNATKTFNFLPSLEAQVVNLADEIAYTAHDTDDGLRSKIITEKQLEKIELWQQAKSESAQKYSISPSKVSKDRIISRLLGIMIKDVCQFSHQTIQENQIDSLEKVHHFKGKLISFSPEMTKKITPLRKFLYQDLYFSETIHQSMKKGQQMIKDLFSYYLDNPQELPNKFQASQQALANKASSQTVMDPTQKNIIIAIKDYIAGMTDSFALAQWNLIN